MSFGSGQLKEILNYNPKTGVFRWKVRVNSHVAAGTIAGTISHHGCRIIAIKRKLYHAHRLAWLYVYGQWPDGDIDHINLDPTDNRISNLRIASRTQNNANSKAKINNHLGVKGVYKHHNRYVAQIVDHKTKRYLGCFKTLEEASAAYATAAKEAFGDFARG